MPIRTLPAARASTVALAVLATVACDSTDPFGPLTMVHESYESEGFVFTGTLTVPDENERTIVAGIRVLNGNDEAAETTILGGTCMLRPRLYDNSSGQLVWSAFFEDQVCPEPARVISLGPGEEELISQSFTVEAPDGPHFVTVTIERTGLIELSAGLARFR